MRVLNWVPYGTQVYEPHGISKAPYGFSRYSMALLLKQPFVALVDHVQVLRNPYGPARAVKGVHKPRYSMGYLHVLWLRVCEIPYVYLTGSVRFTCGYPGGLCGFHTIMGTSYVQVCSNHTVLSGCRAGLEKPIRSVLQTLTGSGEARECMLQFYLPSQTQLCAPYGTHRVLLWIIMIPKNTEHPYASKKDNVIWTSQGS